jgi:hypothetical protein
MVEQPSDLTRTVTDRLAAILSGPPDRRKLDAALRLLAKWRSQILDNTLAARSGDTILGGPFKGMRYPVRAAEGARSARLLGAYEASLSPVLERIIARRVPQIVDIGCAEGYYAVGLALRLPGSTIHAHDTDPAARALVARLAAENGVTDRVRVGGEMDHAALSICAAAETVVICDIEGAEDGLLDPASAPALLEADILVEVHEGPRPGLTDRIAARFAATHHVTRIGRRLDDSALPDWTEALSDMDRLLMLWEWRAAPTPWLWLERKDRA